MTKFELLRSSDPLLHSKSLPFIFEDGYTLENGDVLHGPELFEILKKIMCEKHGVGLSACQIGIMTRVFVIGNPGEPDSIIPVFNPTIVNVTTDQEETLEEGCLSFPGLYVPVKRSTDIRVRFANHNGQVDTAKFSGFTARVFLHEYDHLDGITFQSRAHKHHLERAQKNQIINNRRRKKNLQK